MRKVIIAGALSAVLTCPELAIAQSGSEPPAQTQIDRSLIGLPIISSDGSRNVGMVTEVLIDDGEAIIIGEIERPLGMGGDLVAIPADMIVKRGDHVQLTITEAQIRDRAARPE